MNELNRMIDFLQKRNIRIINWTKIVFDCKIVNLITLHFSLLKY